MFDAIIPGVRATTIPWACDESRDVLQRGLRTESIFSISDFFFG